MGSNRRAAILGALTGPTETNNSPEGRASLDSLDMSNLRQRIEVRRREDKRALAVRIGLAFSLISTLSEADWPR
jgi:hypothetical protein